MAVEIMGTKNVIQHTKQGIRSKAKIILKKFVIQLNEKAATTYKERNERLLHTLIANPLGMVLKVHALKIFRIHTQFGSFGGSSYENDYKCNRTWSW